MQSNGSDCGVYAIAFATFSIVPGQVTCNAAFRRMQDAPPFDEVFEYSVLTSFGIQNWITQTTFGSKNRSFLTKTGLRGPLLAAWQQKWSPLAEWSSEDDLAPKLLWSKWTLSTSFWQKSTFLFEQVHVNR